MREPEWRIRLYDMLVSAEKIERYCHGLSKGAFAQNELVVDAVLRNLEVIGVASRHIPDTARSSMPEIAWNQIWGMRNRLAHDYPGIDLELNWETVELRIPELIAQLRPLVGSVHR